MLHMLALIRFEAVVHCMSIIPIALSWIRDPWGGVMGHSSGFDPQGENPVEVSSTVDVRSEPRSDNLVLAPLS